MDEDGSISIVDVAFGLGWITARGGIQAGRVGLRILGPPIRVAERALRPSPLPERFWPATALRTVADRGQARRQSAVKLLAEAVHLLVPMVLDALLDEVDLTKVISERVDLDAVVARADIDAMAARLDLDALIDRMPIDHVLARVDLDAVAATLDVDAIINRVDLDAVAATLDVDAIINRVDLDAVAATLDVDAVINRVDLVGLARYIIDEVDLPEIIRESSGSMASEAVRGVRMQTIDADERLNRVVDRVLHRRHERRTAAPVLPAPDELPHNGHDAP